MDYSEDHPEYRLWSFDLACFGTTEPSILRPIMLTPTLRQELETTLETTLLMASKGTPMLELAERVYESEPELMSKVQKLLVLDRLVWMISRIRQTIPSVDSGQAQLLLPGFDLLPRRLPLRGRRVDLTRARLSELRKYRQILFSRFNERKAKIVAKDPSSDPKIAILDRLITLVSQYSAEKRGITVAAAMAAEKAKQS